MQKASQSFKKPSGMQQQINNIYADDNDELDDSWDQKQTRLKNPAVNLGKARPQTSYKAAGIRGVGIGGGSKPMMQQSDDLDDFEELELGQNDPLLAFNKKKQT